MGRSEFANYYKNNVVTSKYLLVKTS